MGTCYSQKARGTDPHTARPPGAMPELEPGVHTASPSSSTKSRSSNLLQCQSKPWNDCEQPESESCTALNTLAENTPRMSQKSQPLTSTTSSANTKTTRSSRSRFGFKVPRPVLGRKPDANSNLMTTSTDSVNSASSSHSDSSIKGQTGLTSKHLASGGAYEADGADKWLMIDDSRSNSRASSFKSRKSAGSKERLLADINNGNRDPVAVDQCSSSSVSLDNKDKTTLSRSGGGSRLPGPRTQSKGRGSFLRFGGTKKDSSAARAADNSTWVKAAASSNRPITGPGQRGTAKKLEFANKFEDGSKKAEGRDKKSETVSRKRDTGVKKLEGNGRKPEQRSGGRGAVSFLRSLGKARTSPILAMSGEDQADLPAKGVEKEVMEKAAQPREVLQVKAPIAVIESAETTSIGSINSDDLMLDVDINLDGYDDDGHGYSQSAQSLTRSRNPSCSKSQESVELTRSHHHSGRQDGVEPKRPSGLAQPSGNVVSTASTAAAVGRYERKPILARRYPGESSSLPRRHNSVGHTQKMTLACNRQSQSNEPPLQELATLMQESAAVRRRPPKLSKNNRPASFPCPSRKSAAVSAAGAAATSLDGDGDARPVAASTTSVRALKPPRQHTLSVGDDEQVTVDGFTYRHMIQDMTNLKTMLLRLKRVIQEDEFGCWKNGLRLTGSQPNSPLKEDLTLLSYLEEGEEAPSKEKLMQENAELRQQLQVLHHQLEEQETTVRLLQQQMTKYETGGQLNMTSVGTQTESKHQQQEPSLPLARSRVVGRPPRGPLALQKYRSELSSSSHLSKEIALKPRSKSLTSSGPGSACVGIACAVGAYEMFEPAENGSTGAPSDNSGNRSPGGDSLHSRDTDETVRILNAALTDDNSALGNRFTAQEEEDGATELKASNETVTTDTSGYVSDVTSLNDASNMDMPRLTLVDAGLKSSGLPSCPGTKTEGTSIPKAGIKPDMPRSCSQPTTVARPNAGGGAKQSKLSRLSRQSGQGQGHGVHSTARAKTGGFQSRLPALGVKKITRSNPQLHSFSEQQQATTG